MKTILLSVLMLGAALTADAQATVKANFAKNDTTFYKDVIKWIWHCLWDKATRRLQ